MATPNVKRVPVQLDKKRHIVLDLNALCRAQEVTGRNFMKPATWDDLSFLDVRALLYAGLLKDDPKITLEQVGALVHMGNLGEITGALNGAYSVAMPEATPEAERPLVERVAPSMETASIS